MLLFSQRKSIKPIKSIIQVDFIDDDLRNGLWDVLTIYYRKVKDGIEVDYGEVLR